MNEFLVVRSSKDDTMCNNVKYRIPFPMPSFVVIDTWTEMDASTRSDLTCSPELTVSEKNITLPYHVRMRSKVHQMKELAEIYRFHN